MPQSALSDTLHESKARDSFWDFSSCDIANTPMLFSLKRQPIARTSPDSSFVFTPSVIANPYPFPVEIQVSSVTEAGAVPNCTEIPAEPLPCAAQLLSMKFVPRTSKPLSPLFRATQLEQISFEKVYLLCKDLSANPCHEMLVGELGLPLSKHFKVKML